MIVKLYEFAMNHPILVGGFSLILLVWIIYEARRSSQNVISSTEATQLINREDALVVDLRELKEFKNGHISGARNVPNTKLAQRLPELDKFKDKPLILVCQNGQHAHGALTQLQKSGFERVYRLRGGISQWQADKMPTVTR